MFGAEPHFYQLARDEVRIYATRTEDRYGNWVTYDYVGDQLQKIEANDGRKITFEYHSGNGKLHFARAHGRTWEYNYTGSKRLSEVILPDFSKWTYDTTVMVYVYDQDVIAPTCGLGAKATVVTRKSYTFTHPSGATGVFDFYPIRHSRSGVTNACESDDGIITQGVAREFDVYALARKTITGPGIPALVWTLGYGTQTTLNTTKLATLTMPNASKRVSPSAPNSIKTKANCLKKKS